MSNKFIPLDGRRFDRLLVTRRAVSDGNQNKNKTRWECVCDCGNTVVVNSQDLRLGHTSSCGCKKKENKSGYIHGKTRTQEHNIWIGMIARCENPNVKNYRTYGAVGISVCQRWRRGEGGLHAFECFLADMGNRPTPKHSLERKDSTKNYEPSNVRWALPLEQANNKRRTRWVLYRGQRMSLCDAVRAAGSVIHHEAAAIRLKSGWSVERALETPSTKSPKPTREVAQPRI